MNVSWSGRKLVPDLAIEFGHFDQAAVDPHLFEKEGNAGRLALITGGTRDGELIEWNAFPQAGFKAEDNQVELWKIVEDGGGDTVEGIRLATGIADRADVVEINNTECGFVTDKVPASRGLKKVKDALIGGILILDGYTQPNIIRNGQGRSFGPGEAGQFSHTIRSFGEDHEGMAGGLCHDGKDLLDEFNGNIQMEEIGHRIDENPAGFSPMERNVQPVGMNSDIGELALTPKAVGEALGIAVGTAPTDFCTAGGRVPDFITPINSRGHCSPFEQGC